MAAALALLIADPLILGSQQATALSDVEEADLIQSQADRAERMTVPVAVDGAGPYRFLIDTGSQRTVVSTSVATRLALAPGPTVRIIGVAGIGTAATARVDQIEFGKQVVANLTVPLLEHQHIGADGIIGTDALQDQRVVFDFTKETISIGSPEELGRSSGYEIVVRARRRSGRLILTNAVIDGVQTDVVVDTGASGTIGNRALQRAMRERNAGVGSLTSVTGHVLPADFGLSRLLKLGKLQIGNVLIAFADAPAFTELRLDKRPAILLGMREMRAFKRVAIDFSTRRVLFELVKD
ncbi:aspartyl protease family protein [Novosphingobium sp. M1R2S20]|uniref:Aspartyl protease family protein n=1 Tax=Novosphingobium rhizovicinum TaxID=3228928 RepID=A0ABV3RCJ0_9SPHN